VRKIIFAKGKGGGKKPSAGAGEQTERDRQIRRGVGDVLVSLRNVCNKGRCISIGVTPGRNPLIVLLIDKEQNQKRKNQKGKKRKRLLLRVRKRQIELIFRSTRKYHRADQGWWILSISEFSSIAPEEKTKPTHPRRVGARAEMKKK
jgi:hypothetical protein